MKRNVFSASVFRNLVLALVAVSCILPFALLVIISLTDESTLVSAGYSFFPKKVSLDAYRFIFGSADQLCRSYLVSITVTVIGTAITLLVVSMYAYALFRSDFAQRRFFAFFCFFTMLFNGGLVPTYIVVSNFLGLRNSIWALILPLAVNAFYILVLRTFFAGAVPTSLIESAKIDGAGEFRTFFQIVLPISLPGLATIALFSTMGYWNDWFQALLYIETPDLIPLQAMLMKIENNLEFMMRNSAMISDAQTLEIVRNLPRESSRMAMVVLTTGPIILVYPFFQRYFVSGLTVGAVKG